MKNLEEKKLLVPLQIQFFGDEGEENQEPTGDDNELTFDEILSVKEYKSEFDRRVNDAIIANTKNQAKKAKKQQASKVEGTQEPVEVKNPFMDKFVQAEIKLSLIENGVAPDKASKAVRLIDAEGLLDDDGEISEVELNGAIAELLKEWPELKTTKEPEEEEKKGLNFKIGGDNSKGTGNADDLIAQAFGNK
jgi:hypothetical protein